MVVVITSGGVKEKIDNVRNITNSSSGALGLKIANEFMNNCKDCHVIYIHGGVAKPCENAENIYIRDTQDLLDTVSHILITRNVDIFVHAMAVADYTTSMVIDFEKVKQLVCLNKNNINDETFDLIINSCTINNESKMSSNIESPAVVLKKTPKVIEHIKKLSPYTFLVGFKLLDNVSEEELFDVGFNLLRKNRCNLVLANDIHNIRMGNHRGMIIYPEKTYDFAEGKDEIAKTLVEKIISRYNVGHPKSIKVSEDNQIDKDTYIEFVRMGAWLNKNDFLPQVINHERTEKLGTYGNLSMKTENKMFITSRNVNKANLMPGDISKIDKVDIFEGKNVYSNVYYNSVLKPSIDTTIHSEIYKYSKYSHIVHIHTNYIFLGYPLVEDTYPCGCDKECNAIVDIVKKYPDTRVVQMKKHGLIILGNSFDDCANTIESLFNTVPYINYDSNDIHRECKQHIVDVRPSIDMEGKVYPLMIGNQHIGFIYENITDVVHFGLYTMENIRGKGLNIVKKYLSLYSKKYMLHTTGDCNISNFYIEKHGFKPYNIKNLRNMMYIK